jgi:hypothetical protein
LHIFIKKLVFNRILRCDVQNTKRQKQENVMDELVSRIASVAGIDEGSARQAVVIILNFMAKNGDNSAVSKILDAIPGARDVVEDDTGGGGGFGSIMGGGLMGVANELMGVGVGMGDIPAVTKETISYAREKAGDEPVDQMVSSISGLSQFA